MGRLTHSGKQSTAPRSAPKGARSETGLGTRFYLCIGGSWRTMECLGPSPRPFQLGAVWLPEARSHRLIDRSGHLIGLAWRHAAHTLLETSENRMNL